MESFFGDNLRYLRKKGKLSLEELSAVLRVSKSSLSDYENQKTFPPLDVCRRISQYFQVPLDQLENLSLPHATPEQLTPAPGEPPRSESEEMQDLRMQLRLGQQQVEGLHMQIRLQNQLLESKNSEINSLRIQIQLLEEKIKLRGG